MDNNVGKDDNDTKSPTGVASFLLNTLRRTIFPSVTHSVNHDDDTADDDKTNNDQKNYSPSERLYDLCSRNKFISTNDTIVDPVLVALRIHQLVKSHGDDPKNTDLDMSIVSRIDQLYYPSESDRYKPYLILKALTELDCNCLCNDHRHEMLYSTCYHEFIENVLDMYSELQQDQGFTEQSLISISKKKVSSEIGPPPDVKRTTTHSSEEDETAADDAGDFHQEFCHSAETDGSETSFSERQVEMRKDFDPNRLPGSTSSKDSCLNGLIPAASSQNKKKKRGRRDKSRNNRGNARKAINNEVGSRIVYMPQFSSDVAVTNGRRCLLDAILSLVPDDESIHNHIKQEFVNTMSSKGDTPVSVGIKALSGQQMTLKHVTCLYKQPNKSLVYSLLNIREQCQLVLVIRLWTRKVGPNGENYTDHCVAWDGTIVHDQPRSVRVNNSTDRSTEANCRAVLQRLFPTKDYSSWQIIQVFKLEGTTIKNDGKKKEGAKKGPVLMGKKKKLNRHEDRRHRHRQF